MNETDKKKDETRNAFVGYALIGAVILFTARAGAKSGTKAAMKPILKELAKIDENVFYNAQVTFENVQDTVHNGKLILDAIAQAQPAINAINAIKPG